MRRSKGLVFCGTLVLVSSCGDTPSEPVVSDVFANYIAIGSYVSMGWMSNGVNATSQLQSWPKLLATAAGGPFELPLIDEPGCPPPLASPLNSFRRIDGSPSSGSGTCSQNLSGVLLPTNNLAIPWSYINLASETQFSAPVISRVLPPGLSQITAMRARKPTFVSVEAGVSLLFPDFQDDAFHLFKSSYDAILDSVKATGARAVLVGPSLDLRQSPAIRTGPEIASQRAALAQLNVAVNSDCDASPNFVYVPRIVLRAIVEGANRASAGMGPAGLSCTQVSPGRGQLWYSGVFTPANIAFLNKMAAERDAEIRARAEEHGYAFFRLDTLYATSKVGVPFDAPALLDSGTPYGPLFSLNGIHPNSAGQKTLANAAIAAINLRYRLDIPPLN